ncbi:MAG: dockerin type I repeat-containing protein [Oscillospiraceae bacterium]|nr:dockerin type I repeat-containing protein [Oscillospiraceae bacterium]
MKKINKIVTAVFNVGLLTSLIGSNYAQALENNISFQDSNISNYNTAENIVLDGVLSATKKEILAGKDNADIIFHFQTNVDSDEFMLYENDVAVGTLVDSGNYEQDGDDIQGDGVYSMKFTIDVTSSSAKPTDNKKVVYNSYDVRYEEETVSNEISIDIVTPFTEQELEDMETVDEAVSQLLNSDDYKSMDTQQKADAVLELLKSFEEKGLVNNILLNELQISFLYNSGVKCVVFIDSFGEDYELTVPDNVTATMHGDVNLDNIVNVADVVTLNAYFLNSAEISVESDVSLANADCLKDNYINTSDATLIMNYVCMTIPFEHLGK